MSKDNEPERVPFNNKEEWVRGRGKVVTGSDVGIIMENERSLQFLGYDYEPDQAGHLVKKFDQQDCQDSEEKGSFLMFRVGTHLEKLCGQLQVEHLEDNSEDKYMFWSPYTAEHEIYVLDGWKGASPDFFMCTGRRGLDDSANFLLECKTTKTGVPKLELLIDHYQWQCRWYMHVMDMDRCDLSILFMNAWPPAGEPGGYLHVPHTIMRDEKIEKEMLDRCQEFYTLLSSERE